MHSCASCGKEIAERKKFCDNKCQATEGYRAAIEAWLDKKLVGHKGKALNVKPFVRRYLLEEANHQCSKCGWDTPHPSTGVPPLEVNHIDGDASNTWKENLEVLCPNCHALTPTFRNRNKNSKRNRK